MWTAGGWLRMPCVSSPATDPYMRYVAALGPCATLAFAFGAWRFTRHSSAAAAALAAVLVAVMGFVVVQLHRGRTFEKDAIYAHAPIIAVSIGNPRHRNRSDAAHATRTTLNTVRFPRDPHALPRDDDVSGRAHRERL